MTDEPRPFTYEYFKTLSDKELADIALLEASWDHSHLATNPLSSEQRDLLAALANRIYLNNKKAKE